MGKRTSSSLPNTPRYIKAITWKASISFMNLTAEKIPAVTGYDEELKNFQSFLSTVKSFMNDMQKARSKGAYSDKEYQAMSEAYEYGLSVI